MILATTDHNSKPAFETEYRGSSYFLRQDVIGRWEVHSRRLALGSIRNNMGTFRYFETLQAVSNSVKAFAGIDQLVAL